MKFSLKIPLFLLFFPILPAAYADSCSDSVQSIELSLANGQTITRRWANTWGMVWGSATASQIVIASVTPSKNTSKDLWVGAGSAALGLIPTWISPAPILSGLPPSTSNDSCKRLKELNLIVDQDADADDRMTGWVSHSSNVVINVGIGMLLGFGFGHWNSAVLSTAIGIPVGEVMILTYPQSARKLRDRLQAGNLESSTQEENSWLENLSLRVLPGPDRNALALSLSF